MHFSDIKGNLEKNQIWLYFWFLDWQKLSLQPLDVLNFFLLVCKLSRSGLQIIHYILKVSGNTNIVYIGKYLVLTYIDRFFSTGCCFLNYICCFLNYICWSVNCMSWVSKFFNFFWHAQILRPDLYLRALSNVIYGKFNSNFLVLF